VGKRPPWVVEEKYEWLWLYAAVEPRTGASFFLLLPALNGECFELFLRELAKTELVKPGVLGVNYFSPSATIRIPDRFLVFGDAVPG